LLKRHIIRDTLLDQQKFIVKPNCVVQTKKLNETGTHALTIVNAHKFGSNSRWQIDMGKIPSKSFNLVIIDESHHYPAATWKRIVDYFEGTKILFLTATPSPVQLGFPAYVFQKSAAIDLGIIRDSEFIELNSKDQRNDVFISISHTINEYLKYHNKKDSRYSHQAMVLTHKRNEADAFVDCYNTIYPDQARPYHGKHGKDKDLEEYEDFKFTVLVVCGKLLEGYDRKEISVLAIIRNISPRSKVLFTQFVGRGIRKYDSKDPVTTAIISHISYNQKENYDFYKNNEISSVDPEDEVDPEREINLEEESSQEGEINLEKEITEKEEREEMKEKEKLEVSPFSLDKQIAFLKEDNVSRNAISLTEDLLKKLIK